MSIKRPGNAKIIQLGLTRLWISLLGRREGPITQCIWSILGQRSARHFELLRSTEYLLKIQITDEKCLSIGLNHQLIFAFVELQLLIVGTGVIEFLKRL